MESALQGDLGAESIDFLDIVFRLEREFGIRIPRGELFPESIFQGDPDYVDTYTSKITDKGVQYLTETFPWANVPALAAKDGHIHTSNLSDLFTVESLVNYIESRLQKR